MRAAAPPHAPIARRFDAQARKGRGRLVAGRPLSAGSRRAARQASRPTRICGRAWGVRLLGEWLGGREPARVASAWEAHGRERCHGQVQADQDGRDRRQTGIGLLELVDELASVTGGEDEPETGDAEQREPRPAAEPDDEGEQERGDDGDDRQDNRLRVDAEDGGARLAVALLDVLRALTGATLAARLATRAALGRRCCGGRGMLGVTLMSLDRRADRE